MALNSGTNHKNFPHSSNSMLGPEFEPEQLNLQTPFMLPIRSTIMKRFFDIVIGVFMLIFFLPLIIIISVTLRCTYGKNVFYGQKRIAKGGKTFRCWKFSTMVPDAELHLQDILNSDLDLRIEWEKTHKLKNDPRVHRVGAILRKSSLDELPQLINVIKGEMSLVGPRPVTGSELKKYKQFASYYLAVRPGLTGLWQISGRNDVDYDTRVRLDVTYVRNWSFVEDLRIFIKTTIIFILGQGAY